MGELTSRQTERTMTVRGRAYPQDPLHGQVVHSLGELIVRGTFPPGSAVPTEEQLVEQLGLGRSALREGIKVLAGKGLLETRTSAGTLVRPRASWNLLDPDVLRWRFAPPVADSDGRTLADLRVALEPGAARLAAESRDAEGLQQVETAMAALWATVDDTAAFVEADLAFHRAVFAAANNDLLLYLYDVMSVAMDAVRPIHTQSVRHNKETLPNHEKVTIAIRRRHHHKAEEVMREIVEIARADALASLRRQRRQVAP